jgi:hypothetical protein
VRCGKCGNENDEANRFCGMCGASLLATTEMGSGAPAAVTPTGSVAAPSQTRSSLPEPAALGVAKAESRPAPPPSSPVKPSELRSNELRPSDPRPSAARTNTGPVITGHSFLGLSTPGPAPDRSAGSDTLRPSSNVDYLLDDEEEPKRGWGKLVLVAVALALAVGLGYLHFKQAGFDGLISGDKKPMTAKATPDAAPSPDSAGAIAPATPDSSAPSAGMGNNATAPASASGAATPTQAPSPSAPSQTAPPPSQAVPAASAPAQSVPSRPAPSQDQQGDPNLPAAAATPAASSPDNQAPTAEAQPAPKAVVPVRRMPKPPAARPLDPVTNAERYLYGRGEREDCDHGLRLLKQAVDESNPKAMTSMGALYSTGTCTPRDLPTAYRWFALALHREPDNQALQDDLQKLWSQMTQPERQLAIKLSQ